MKRNLFEKEGEGIRLLSRRFISGLSISDLVFRSKQEDRKMFELSFIITLSLFIVLFSGWRRFETRTRTLETSDLVFQVEMIPQTEQKRLQPAPARPSVPIASESEEIPEEATIEFTNIDFEDTPPPPPPLDGDDGMILFVPFDEPPVPIGGFKAILKHLKYPEIGRLAGIQGFVVLHLQIDENGDVVDIRTIKSLGSGDFVEAASKAVRAVKWKPAKQRERPVKVWYSVPIEFTLNARS
jgi:protein TonB